MNALLSILYVLGIYGAYMAGFIWLRSRSSQSDRAARAFRFPWITLFLFFIIAIPSILQLFFPAILTLLQRDTDRVVRGEWWRLVTFLFAQDGGVTGTAFNLISLLLIGLVAEQFWNPGEMLLLFFLGGLFGGVVGLLWQPIGAGNSVGNFSLAGSVATLCLRQRPARPIQIPVLLTLLAGVILALWRDIHGPAVLMGALLAVLLRQKQPYSIKENL